jgi:hypothetical protein
MDTLPLYSSNSSNLVEQSASQLPDDNPLNVQLFGDNELDSLFKENLNGLLRNKKVKKPRKKEKTKPIQKVSFFVQIIYLFYLDVRYVAKCVPARNFRYLFIGRNRRIWLC